MSVVWVDGEFVERDAARVSAFDSGLQHAVGLFETMSARLVDGGAEVVRLAEHMDRLGTSARQLGLSDDLRTGALGDAVTHSVLKAGYERARVRLTVTGGDLNLLSRRDAKDPHRPTLLIDVQPATGYPDAMFEKGVMVRVADEKTNPLDPTASHKTLNYWWRLRALQSASGAGAAEALVFQVSNHLAGGCVSNVLLVKDGSIITPIARGEEEAGGLPSPVLPGVTRGAALKWADGQGVPVETRMVTIDDVLGADEVLMTNSSWGVLPVVAIETSRIGAGVPGEMCGRLREAVV